jgi:hypothetical protein
MQKGCSVHQNGYNIDETWMQKGSKRDAMYIEGDAMYIKMDKGLIKNGCKRDAVHIKMNTQLSKQ